MSVFRVLETEIEVRESALLIRVCLVMVSNGPLLQDVFFDLIGENRTAIGKKFQTIMHCQSYLNGQFVLE